MSFNPRKTVSVEGVYGNSNREVKNEQPDSLSDYGTGLGFGKFRWFGFEVSHDEQSRCGFAAAELLLQLRRRKWFRSGGLNLWFARSWGWWLVQGGDIVEGFGRREEG